MYIQKLEDNTILLTAPVMIPGKPDCDFSRGEPPLTVEQVKNFKESYKPYQFVDSEHELTRTGKYRGLERESHILTEDTEVEVFDGSVETYPKGTWMMTSHITDPEAIRAAEKGDYTGYSVSIRSRSTAEKFRELIQQMEYEKAEALKSQSLSGLIKDVPDPVVLSVSLVRKPCQTGSKICKLRNGDTMTDSESNVKSKVLNALGMSDAADVEALKSQVDSLDDKLEGIKAENAEALKSMKEEIISEFKDALAEFADKSKEEEEEGGEDPQSEEESTEQESAEDQADDEEEKKKEEADKGSKQGANHNGANKSQETEILDTYEFLGRYPDGTPKRL